MSKVVLKKASKPVEASTPASPTTTPPEIQDAEIISETSSAPAAPAETTAAPLARRQDVGVAGLEGDFDAGDIKMPRLQCVQGSGKMSELYLKGSVILMDEVLLNPPASGTKPVLMKFVTMFVRKQFREILEQGSEEMPRAVDTQEQVRELGGVVGYEIGEWRRSAQVFLLLEKPDDVKAKDHPAFNVTVGGKDYAPCVMYVQSNAYTEFAVPIITAARSGLLRDEKLNPLISARFFTLKFDHKRSGAFVVLVPYARATMERTSEELQEVCRTFFPASSTPAAVATPEEAS